ncbi:MAG: alpha/beta hydrolase [Acidimicrobiia bacterium]
MTSTPRRLALPLLFALLLSACGGGGGSGDAAEDDPLEDDVTATQPGERAVQVAGADRTRIFGTLTVPPAAARASVPGVLLLPSAGSGDRNGTISPNGVPSGLGRELAGAFSDAGLVTYRYDRRGTGESRLESGAAVTVDALVDDARAALDLMAQRKETEGKDLAVVAYEEGGLIALRLAAADPRVKRLVLVSTPGRSLADVHAARLAAQYGPESADAFRATVANLLASRTLPPLAEMRTEHRALLPPEDAAFLADLYAIDPAAEAARVKVPTMIVVPALHTAAYDAPRLAAALPGAQVVNAAGGANLQVVGNAPLDDKSDPTSPNHEHGAGPPVAPSERDAPTFDRITGFLTAARP